MNRWHPLNAPAADWKPYVGLPLWNRVKLGFLAGINWNPLRGSFVTSYQLHVTQKFCSDESRINLALTDENKLREESTTVPQLFWDRIYLGKVVELRHERRPSPTTISELF